MKTPIVLLFVVCSIFVQSQVTINIWRIKPDTVCPGDSIKINYVPVPAWPTGPNLSTNNFWLNSVAIWAGNWSILKARPKETWAPMPITDSAHWIKIKIPANTAPGTKTLTSNGGSSKTFYVKNCSCTITANFAYTVNNMAVTFSNTSVGTTSQTVFNWDLGFGTGFQAGPAVQTVTYVVPQTYSVTLLVTNPTCTDVITKSFSVAEAPTSTVGIEEYRVNGKTPVYYDLQGNKTEAKANTLLIEQVGLKRRKIVITETN